jgi:hypothetical protein
MSIFDRRIVACAVLSAIASSFAPTTAAAQTPPPQETESPAAKNFRRVDRFASVSVLLHLAQGTVRVVTIVPVESPSSFAVIDTVMSVVAANPSKRLRAYVILRGGGESALRALQLATRYSDSRVAYFWDPTGAVASAWDSGATTAGTVWIYDTSAKFSDRPPAAALTVDAQTDEGGVTLDGAALRAESGELVRRVEAKMASAPSSEPTESRDDGEKALAGALAGSVLAIGTMLVASTTLAAHGDITLLGQINPIGSDQFTNLWGFERDGRAYAVVGDWDSGPIIIDVTDPTNPFVRKTITGAGVFGFDVKVWGNYIYTCEGRFGAVGASSRAIDITNLDVPVISDAFTNAHALSIHPDGYLFAEYLGLRCYDLNADPTPAGYLWYDGTNGGHDSTVDVEHNRLYDFHGYDDTHIWDITNINSRVLLGSIVDPTILYSHSGDATEDGNHLFVCDEFAVGEGKDCTVWLISNPATPTKVGTVSDISATIRNLYVVGDFAFVSYYTAGFRVYDVANPASPVLLDTYDTDPLHTGDGWESGCYGIYPYGPNGVVYATDQENGLFLFGVEGFTGLPTGVDDTPRVRAGARVLGNYPNPFNPSTTIAYEIDRGADVTLAIHDATGRLVRVLFRGREDAGRHEVPWDGVDGQGARAASGVYFVRLDALGTADTGRLVLLK